MAYHNLAFILFRTERIAPSATYLIKAMLVSPEQYQSFFLFGL
jgi:hypothetical protein